MTYAEVYLTCPITLLHRRYHRLSPTVFIFVFTLDAAYNWCFSIEGIVTVAVLASLCSHRLCLALIRLTPPFLTCLVSPPSLSHSSLSSATQSRPSSSSSLTYLPTTYTVFSHSVSHPLHPTHWQPSVTQDTTAIYPYRTISSCSCT